MESDTASEEDEVPLVKAEAQTGAKITGLAGLDRAAMERERLERAKKAGIIGQPPEPPLKRPKKENLPTQLKPPVVLSKSGLQYPNGTIKWTYAEGYPRENHTITIEEVLQKDTLKAAVLSAFQVLCLPSCY